ncbi:MAG: ATPase [Nitrospirae bacterium]|nr:ATPase [Nitrospirota bacterium]
MKKIVFITGPDAECGFRLTGVAEYTIGKEELEDVLKSVIGKPESGLVVVDDRLIQGMSESRLRELERRWFGILLILPAPERPGVEVEDYAMRLIKRAIGYHVRLKL